jgi:hypothetical protein
MNDELEMIWNLMEASDPAILTPMGQELQVPTEWETEGHWYWY